MKKMNISKRIKRMATTMALVATMAMTVTTTAFAAETDGSKSGRLPAGQEEPAHYHQPGWIAKEATCTEPGLMQDICPYHPDYVWSEEEIPALGHDMGEWTIVREATYEEEGLKVRDCSRGDLHEEEVIPKLEKEPEDEPSSEEPVHEHTFGDWTETTAPTCTKTGEATRVCDCGETETKVIDSLGHNLGDWTIVREATYDEEGLERRECSRCDYNEERAIESPERPHEHAFGDWTETTAPTCTKTGEATRVCDCGETETKVIDALGHKMGSWTVVKAATCTEDGVEARYCDRCGIEETRTIKAHGHVETTVAGKAATCTKDGLTDGVVCDICGEVIVAQEVIPATGHNYSDWTVVKAATCTEDGVEERICENCGHKESREIKAHGHKEVTVPGKAATCTKDGLTAGVVCDTCGEVIVAQEVIPATGHSYGEWTVVKAPEIGVEGIEEHVCSRCGHKEQRTIPALTDDNTPDDDIVPDDNDEDIVPEDDDEPDVLSEYIPEDDDDDNNDDVVNNEPDVLSEYIPQTGDTNNAIIYIVMMLGALLVLVAATRKEEQ